MNKHGSLRIYTLFAFLLILPGFFLTACQPSRNSAEQAAVEQLIQLSANSLPASTGEVIDPRSIESLQSQEFENSTYVLISYRRKWNNRDEKCVSMVETHYDLFSGWKAGSGMGACSEIQEAGTRKVEPIWVSAGTLIRKDQGKPDLSFVLGRVNDEAIIKAVVTWKDGQRQEAEVVNSSFLVIRNGQVEMQSAVGLVD